jgi:hypothetical protein
MIKPGDKRFELPPIKSAEGKDYKPAPPNIVRSATVDLVALNKSEETEIDASNGYLMCLAAAIASANHDHATAAHFWRGVLSIDFSPLILSYCEVDPAAYLFLEGAHDLRLENNVVKAEWAEWALKNADENSEHQAKLLLKNKPEVIVMVIF